MNDDTSGEWIVAAPASAVPPGGMLGVIVGTRDIALYNIGGEFYATDNLCTHAFGCLTDGWLDGDTIECPLHAGRFDVKTGRGLGPPIPRDIQVHQARQVGDEIQVRLAPA